MPDTWWIFCLLICHLTDSLYSYGWWSIIHMFWVCSEVRCLVSFVSWQCRCPMLRMRAVAMASFIISPCIHSSSYWVVMAWQAYYINNYTDKRSVIWGMNYMQYHICYRDQWLEDLHLCHLENYKMREQHEKLNSLVWCKCWFNGTLHVNP